VALKNEYLSREWTPATKRVPLSASTRAIALTYAYATMRLPKERTGKSPLAEEEDVTHTHGERETHVHASCARNGRTRLASASEMADTAKGYAQQRMQGNVHGHESGLNARRWTLPPVAVSVFSRV